MMTEIYVVIRELGEFSERHEDPVKAFKTVLEAQNFVTRCDWQVRQVNAIMKAYPYKFYNYSFDKEDKARKKLESEKEGINETFKKLDELHESFTADSDVSVFNHDHQGCRPRYYYYAVEIDL